MLVVEVCIVVVLIILNGLLAMSELAIVSSRPARLRRMAEMNVSGSRRAVCTENLNPNVMVMKSAKDGV